MVYNTVRIGVLGAANIALRSVIPALLQLRDRYTIAAIARRDSAMSNPNLDQFHVVEGYENLLKKEIIDAVYIPLPNALHYEWVKKSLEKGIHVLVEKPLACEYKEVLELNEIAKAKGLVLVENFQFRFHSQMDYVQSVIAQGLLGEMRVVRSTFCFPPFPDNNNIRYQKSLGGGALLDAAAYPVKVSQLLLGNDLTVNSAVLNYQNHRQVDIWGGAFLKQNNGRLFSQIAFGFDNYYQCNVELVGSIGKLYTNRLFTANETVRPKFVLETQLNGAQEIELEPDNHFKKMLLYFYDLITERKPKSDEYSSNTNQARLLYEIKQKSNE